MATTAIVTNAGLAYIVDAIDATLAADVESIGIGTGSTAVAAGDTTLDTEVETRANATLSQPSAAVLQAASAAISITGTRALREAGLFNAATSGTLITRSVFDVINLESGDTYTPTFQITFADNS